MRIELTSWEVGENHSRWFSVARWAIGIEIITKICIGYAL
jgi:hypothetical protein